MRYFVTDYNLIPLSCQPEEGYTLTDAIARYNREVKFSKEFVARRLSRKLTQAEENEIERDWHIREEYRKDVNGKLISNVVL